MKNFSEQYKEGWNYRCTHVAGGKYKLPRYSAKTAEFHKGFEECDTAHSASIANSIKNMTNPVYPKPLV